MLLELSVFHLFVSLSSNQAAKQKTFDATKLQHEHPRMWLQGCCSSLQTARPLWAQDSVQDGPDSKDHTIFFRSRNNMK